MSGPDEFSLLFVDDEGDFLATIDEFFTSLGYKVYTARNGQEALLRVKEHLPKCRVPRHLHATDGRHRDAAPYPRDRHRNPQVIVVSGYASEDLARDLLKHGACDFFQKPVDLTRLHETIERLRTLQDL